MSVIPLTLSISLCLVFTFVMFFLHEHSRRRFSSAEREALLPLADETPVASGPARHDHGDHHDHPAHGKGPCGCRDGSRPPCPGCMKRPAR